MSQASFQLTTQLKIPLILLPPSPKLHHRYVTLPHLPRSRSVQAAVHKATPVVVYTKKAQSMNDFYIFKYLKITTLWHKKTCKIQMLVSIKIYCNKATALHFSL